MAPPDSAGSDGSDRRSGEHKRSTPESSGRPKRLDVSDAMQHAVLQLAELLRCEPGSVSAVRATDTGWTADVEVLELARVPDTTSLLGSYRVTLDTRGRLTGYERTRRYVRGRTDP
ncbi:gas vesicle protein [Streptomyces triticagri]|uniref:Gas vesicle protein n=1 Tax=Streptomyces triticagri TaxID=2293568 RepID=A0A372LVF4_9ACTN|nr:gas vesicle protein [Streptomyces triticagri]RFU82662.1 gas vesicle protein [Streptomyces triticagri]